jgi:hypothetical protein
MEVDPNTDSEFENIKNKYAVMVDGIEIPQNRWKFGDFPDFCAEFSVKCFIY